MNDTKSPTARIGLIVGLGILAFGIVGLVGAISTRNVATIFKWLIAADLLHDLVVAPAVCATGLTIARLAPHPWRTPIRSAAIASAAVLIVAYPLLRAFGRHHVPDNRSVLPLDYQAGVATLLGVIWGIAIIWACATWWRTRREPTPDAPEDLRLRSGPEQ